MAPRRPAAVKPAKKTKSPPPPPTRAALDEIEVCAAILAAKRPPVAPGDRLWWRVYGHCRNGCEAPLDTYVTRVAPSGVWTVADCCTRCLTVLRGLDGTLRVRDDDPREPGGNKGRRADWIVLQRRPGVVAEVERARAEAAAVEAEIAAEAAARRAARSPVETAPLPVPETPPEAPVAPSKGGVWCLVRETVDNGWATKCGRVVRRAPGVFMPDVRLTGWVCRASCPTCLSTVRFAHSDQ